MPVSRSRDPGARRPDARGLNQGPVRATAGMTLLEVVTVLAIAGVVTSSLYLLLGAAIKGYLIAHARIADEERARQALTWLTDRLRQASADPGSACQEGVVRLGTGTGFAQRLAFRATIDEGLIPPRQTYVFYVEDRTLWQETRGEEASDLCGEEEARAAPDPARLPLTPPVIREFALAYLDRRGRPTSLPSLVRSVQVTLALEAPAMNGQAEVQTYQTVATLRAP